MLICIITSTSLTWTWAGGCSWSRFLLAALALWLVVLFPIKLSLKWVFDRVWLFCAFRSWLQRPVHLVPCILNHSGLWWHWALAISSVNTRNFSRLYTWNYSKTHDILLIFTVFSLFAAEMWFGIVFAVLVEIVPVQVRSTTVGIFLFVMNNVGGNLPILVDPVAKYIGYRGSISIFYAGFYLLSKYFKLIRAIFFVRNLGFNQNCRFYGTPELTTIQILNYFTGSVLFFITIFMMEPSSTDADDQSEQQPPKTMHDNGHDNKVFVGDNMNVPQTNQSRPRIQSNGSTNSYYLHAQPNGLENGDNSKQQTFRIIENSRLW